MNSLGKELGKTTRFTDADQQGITTMRVSTQLPHHDLRKVQAFAQKMERAGLDTIVALENQHNPFLPLAVAALVTERIQYLSKHITASPKDNASKRGLSKLVSQRKRLLTYLEANNREEYKKVIKQLGLRK